MGLYDETVKVGRRTMVLFFIIDTSGSMRGAKIGQVNTAIEGILPKIKEISKENADAEIKVCVLNFATKAKWVTAAPVSVEDEAYRWEYVEAGGTTALGDACRELNEALSTKTFMKEVSDAREYRLKGVPTIQYGPSNTEGIHAPNENVDIEDVVNAGQIYVLSLCDLLGVK